MELQEVVTMGEKAGSMALRSVAAIREKIASLDSRPDPLAVEDARKAMIDVDAALAQSLEAIVFEAAPPGQDALKWRESQAEKERSIKEAAEREKLPLRAILQLDELHQLYEKMLKDAEALLEQNPDEQQPQNSQEQEQQQNAAVGRALDEALEKQLSELRISNQLLQQVPESIGSITSLTVLNLFSNQIEVLPDAIAGLVNLVRLDVHSNRLKILPDSVGLLKKLQYLNVSNNQLNKLPESISECSALIELNADFNKLEYLPSSFGRSLGCLENLSLHLNSLIYLPASLCEIKSLKHLDVHFNKLRSLPKAIGNLTQLTTLDASSNFNDLVWLPDSMGDLVSLTHLDLSYNQIRELPISMGRLSNIRTLKLDENPLVEPPLEIVQQGVEATMKYLADRWEASLLREAEEANMRSQQGNDAAVQGTWLGGWISGVYSNVTNFLTSPKAADRDDYLEQQL